MRKTIKCILVCCALISSAMLCSCDVPDEFIVELTFLLTECCAEACKDEIVISCSENIHKDHLINYHFLHPLDNRSKIRIELVKPDTTWSCSAARQYKIIAEITDIDGFLNEFDDLMCWNAANPYAVSGSFDKLIRIIYPDGQCEIISVCESSLSSDETGSNQTAFGYMVFDKQKYNDFWNKWAAECAVNGQQ